MDNGDQKKIVMAEEGWTPGKVAHEAVGGALALGSRQLLVQAFNVAGGVLLARHLTPEEFGIYAVVVFMLAFMNAFGDVGLAASLIRQPSEPKDADYRSIFTVQQILVAFFVGLWWVFAPWVASLYGLDPDDAWLFRLAALSLLITSFQVIPRVRLERHLAFHKLAIVEVTQALVYNSVAVILAMRGLGAMSFAIALVGRALVGAVLSNWVERWAMGWEWNWSLVRERLRFGLSYQGALVVNLLKDTINPIFVGIFVGAAAAGYINWATMVANYPLIAVMVLQRLYMPVFARLAEWPENLARALHSAIGLISAVAYTAGFLLYVFRDPLTVAIFGAKWTPALELFLPFTLITVLLTPTIIAFGALIALGHSGTVFRFTVAVAIATWVLGPASIVAYGWLGWGWANFGANLIDLLILYELKKRIGFNAFPAVARALVLASVVAAFGQALLMSGMNWAVGVGLSVAFACLAGFVAYRAVLGDIVRRLRPT
jgi:O-antigen/teichoic acid export membrane protein